MSINNGCKKEQIWPKRADLAQSEDIPLEAGTGKK